MPQGNHQTIRLSRGKHISPEHGACVMELASMLAGEEFSDHPRSVCPVIGGFLRVYNDAIDDSRRQDLYRYAAAVVGSRGPVALERRRAAHLRAWARTQGGARRRDVVVRFLLRALMLDRTDGPSAGVFAVRCIRAHDDASHSAVLAVIDELLTIGREPVERPAPVEHPAPGERTAPRRPAAEGAPEGGGEPQPRRSALIPFG